MPEERIKLNLDGRDVEGVRVQVVSSQENFNQYLLEDGTTLRIKLVVVEVVKILDAMDAEGNPVYLTKSRNILVPQVPGKG